MILALVPDLMDRSKVAAAAPVTFVRSAAELGPADLVVVDLSRAGALDAAAELARGGTPVIGFTNHTARDDLATAREAGIDAMARSDFFSRLDELIGRA